uniref:Uncharacterized protein n=1 Tax=Onchocerca volvulus TaxID=6282 RepID=A0A2K6WBT3_ONCVO
MRHCCNWPLIVLFPQEKGKKPEKISLEKQIELAGRLPLKKRGRLQVSRPVIPPQHISHMKKLSTSSETLGYRSTKSILVSDAERLLQVKLPKAEKLDKIKSVESIDVTKLLATEETPSSTEVIPINSYCYCGQDMAISSQTAEELNEKCKVELLPTIVKPVSFDPYSPEDFTQVEGSSDEMSKNSMQINLIPKNHQVIVPFLPILHAITYASKHAQLLQELLQNYEYFESQSLESS